MVLQRYGEYYYGSGYSHSSNAGAFFPKIAYQTEGWIDVYLRRGWIVGDPLITSLQYEAILISYDRVCLVSILRLHSLYIVSISEDTTCKSKS
jgi:hypothetical protein